MSFQPVIHICLVPCEPKLAAKKNKFATYWPCNVKATESELTILPYMSLTRSGFRSFPYSNLVLSGNAPNRYCLLTNGILTLGFPHRHITAKPRLSALTYTIQHPKTIAANTASELPNLSGQFQPNARVASAG